MSQALRRRSVSIFLRYRGQVNAGSKRVAGNEVDVASVRMFLLVYSRCLDVVRRRSQALRKKVD